MIVKLHNNLTVIIMSQMKCQQRGESIRTKDVPGLSEP